jgi:hypothetical protein
MIVLPPCQNVVHITIFRTQKSDDVKFDQVCRKHLQYQINAIRFIIVCTFIWYTFGIVDIDNFLNKLGQTL